MGLLKNASVQDWDDAEEARKYIHEHGVLQFINVYKKYMNSCCAELRWGDEIECNLILFDHENKTVKISQRAPYFIELFAELSRKNEVNFEIKPEYGSYMLELTPTHPYNQYACSLNGIESNMKNRRLAINKYLLPNEHLLLIPHFPLLGQGNFATTMAPLHGAIADSDYLPDTIISPHPRFAALTKNIRKRRGEKVNIQVPIYHDINTSLPPMIHMDAMGFGMGSCCLQVTFQAESLEESRILYDQLVVIAPLVMAMTAYSPIYRGTLSDIDTRWSIISQSVDDRTQEEREGPNRIPKSRYDSVDLFINPNPKYDIFNDLDVKIDNQAYQTLIDNNIDPMLAKHIAHLFIRDALVTYDDYAEKDDMQSSEHFENIQSSNWQSVRWKPPTFGGSVEAWRVELRTMEIMLTEYENAAFTVFAGLLCRAILFYNLELYIPMSKVDENMKRAEKRNALLDQKFWFTNYAVPHTDRSSKFHCCCCCEKNRPYDEYTILEILDGNEHFPGFIPLIKSYLEVISCSSYTLNTVNGYLDFIHKRATGEIMTGASWMRQFVMNHPAYKHDSIVSDEIAYDLCVRLTKISNGEIQEPSLLGSVVINNNEEDDLTPCCDRSILIGKVFKMPEKRISIFDIVDEAAIYHHLL